MMRQIFSHQLDMIVWCVLTYLKDSGFKHPFVAILIGKTLF